MAGLAGVQPYWIQALAAEQAQFIADQGGAIVPYVGQAGLGVARHIAGPAVVAGGTWLLNWLWSAAPTPEQVARVGLRVLQTPVGKRLALQVLRAGLRQTRIPQFWRRAARRAAVARPRVAHSLLLGLLRWLLAHGRRRPRRAGGFVLYRRAPGYYRRNRY